MNAAAVPTTQIHDCRFRPQAKVKLQVVSGRLAGAIGTCVSHQDGRVGVQFDGADSVIYLAAAVLDVIVSDANGNFTPYILSRLTTEVRNGR